MDLSEGYRGGKLNAKLQQQYKAYAVEEQSAGNTPLPIDDWMKQMFGKKDADSES